MNFLYGLLAMLQLNLVCALILAIKDALLFNNETLGIGYTTIIVFAWGFLALVRGAVNRVRLMRITPTSVLLCKIVRFACICVYILPGILNTRYIDRTSEELGTLLVIDTQPSWLSMPILRGTYLNLVLMILTCGLFIWYAILVPHGVIRRIRNGNH